MENTSGSFLANYYSPFLQAAVATGVALLIMIFGQVIQSAGMQVSPRFPWMAAGSGIMLFAIFNSIFSLSAKDPVKNWGQSFGSYIGLVVLVSLMAWGFSGLAIQNAGTFSWIYIVLTFGYLVFMSMVNLMKKIVEFAMKEEWQHPRIRNSKRR